MYQNQIRTLYANFSPAYRRIADYILSHYQDAVFMTAAEIGRAARVDTALVVRFAQRLGYPGFPELIADVQEHVKQELRAVYQPTEGDNSPVQVFRRNLLQDRNNLDYMLLHLDEKNLLEVIGLFNQASRIFVIGEGTVNHFAEAFVLRLLLAGYSAYVISSEMTSQASMIAILSPGDLVIGVGTTAMNPGVATIIREAREIGAHTVGITSSMTHPVAAAAQHVLHVPVFTVGITPSWTAIAAVLHAFIQVLSLSQDNLSAERVMRMDHYLKIYEGVLKKGLMGLRATITEYRAV